jgi:hypothetical protein
MPDLASGFPIADISWRVWHVRVGSNSEVELADADFRFAPDSGHPAGGLGCPLSARSRHYAVQQLIAPIGVCTAEFSQ